MTGTRHRLTVVVPVHDAFEELRRCVASLLEHTEPGHRLVLIDDASTDPRLRPFLELAASEADRDVVLVCQRPNRGYTATINHGIRLAKRDDVVLLNSDTRVTPSWLDKLSAAASSAPRVATVTPLSNAAGAFSVPVNHRVNRLPPGLAAEDMAALLEEVSERRYPRVPTGNGFCMLVRREAIEEVGLFDERAFPRGCGEENDFCMRATRAGFVHLIDDSTFVEHRMSASLGWRKRWLLARASWILRRRYPEYRDLVAAWLADDPVDPLRRELRRRLSARSE